MIALTDGTNKINLAILIREYLKVCLEQEFCKKKCLCFWRVAVSPWKAKMLWLYRVGLQTELQFPLMLPSQALRADLYTSKGHPGEVGLNPLLDECRVQCPQAIWTLPSLWCISAKHRLQTGRTWFCVSPEDEKARQCFTSQPQDRESEPLNQGEVLSKSEKLQLEVRFLFQT